MTDSTSSPCSQCGAPASGHFCDQCGTAIGHRFCGQCGVPATAGARFCAGCGATLGAEGAGGGTATVAEPRAPWMVATVLTILSILLVLWAATKRGDGQAPGVTTAPSAAAATGTPPDLSTMTPREQFTRLNDRIMNAAQTGDSGTVTRFWPMASQAYLNLLPGDLDVDARYHMATLHLLVGETAEALALADTMMTESPDNLLAWYLRAVVAEFQLDAAGQRAADEAFLTHYDAEIGSGRQEYLDHADLLADFKSRATNR